MKEIYRKENRRNALTTKTLTNNMSIKLILILKNF